jgi:4-amino-4-deoxychorismate lyase
MPYHNARANRTRREALGMSEDLELEAHIRIASDFQTGVVRCRVTYSATVIAVEMGHYVPVPIRTLKLVDGRDIDYRYKYADRSALNALYAQRGKCDDILIVKDGLITDTSMANVAFFDGMDWVTPATPLLDGTTRRKLLETGVLKEREIRITDIPGYIRCVAFNAMRMFDPGYAIPVSAIHGL